MKRGLSPLAAMDIGVYKKVMDWKELPNTDIEIIYESGVKEVFTYYGEISDLDYYHSVNFGILAFINSYETRVIHMEGYSKTGNPDDPEWEIIDFIDKIEILNEKEKEKEKLLEL
jgi:hypothetical protein